MSSQEKLKALQLTLDKLEKSYGKGAVMKLGDSAVEPIDSISTGSIGLDIALGIGGVPKGRVIEIYGPESSGKTTLRSEEHTSELQSLMRTSYAVFCWKKKTKIKN